MMNNKINTEFTYEELKILSNIFSNGLVKWNKETGQIYHKIITKKEELKNLKK